MSVWLELVAAEEEKFLAEIRWYPYLQLGANGSHGG
jgi:hypothetical protein